jgi:hypothetical protein
VLPIARDITKFWLGGQGIRICKKCNFRSCLIVKELSYVYFLFHFCPISEMLMGWFCSLVFHQNNKSTKKKLLFVLVLFPIVSKLVVFRYDTIFGN